LALKYPELEKPVFCAKKMSLWEEWKDIRFHRNLQKVDERMLHEQIKIDGRAEGHAQGVAEGREEGVAQGRAEGMAENKLEVAKKALAKGLAERLTNRCLSRDFSMGSSPGVLSMFCNLPLCE